MFPRKFDIKNLALTPFAQSILVLIASVLYSCSATYIILQKNISMDLSLSSI